MKAVIRNTLVKLNGLIASAAMFLALSSVNSTCFTSRIFQKNFCNWQISKLELYQLVLST